MYGKGRIKKHGTRYAYVEGCRCEDCRKANAQYQLKLKKKLASIAIPSHLHGTLNAYANWSCRCQYCKKANAIHSAKTREVVNDS